MSSFTADAEAMASIRRNRVAASFPVLFGLTILSSACLLFLVQPLASKLILPWFGGSAAVWITCMLFFQAGLLLGYSYAHGVARRIAPKRQAVVHTVLLLLSFAALPILPNAWWQPGPSEDPTWKVLGVLATSVGLPYLLLSSTSPLLQSWFARTDSGALPYRYFALSNAGSLVALLVYPILVEPYLTGHQQAWAWSIAYIVFAALCIATGLTSRLRSSAAITEETESTPSRLSEIILWLALAASPSTLLLCVTNLLTQNIAPMPLLWVLPLSVYLLTFILCFESGRWYKRIVFLTLALPALGCFAAALGPLSGMEIAISVPLFCLALFVCCMACHGELAHLRPASAQLTTFYLSLAGGGVIGGCFVALFAPHVFTAPYEFQVSLVACAFLLLIILWRERRVWRPNSLALPLWFVGAASALVFTGYVAKETWSEYHDARLLARNFYGSLRVDRLVNQFHQVYRELSHGTITHGIQFLNPDLGHQPTTYYGSNSGVGLAWRDLSAQGPMRMGVIGLGTGTLAAYGRAGDSIRFYDINPLIVDIARKEFTYLSDCPAHTDVVLGDARLSLAREPDQQFDLLVVDAFSGDAIPVHLLTREAFKLYWRHLKPDGVLAVHVSNQYLDLNPVVALAASEIGKTALKVESDEIDRMEVYPASYVLVTSRPKFFDNALFKGRLSKVKIPPHLHTWTDDYSNLWQVLTLRDKD